MIQPARTRTRSWPLRRAIPPTVLAIAALLSFFPAPGAVAGESYIRVSLSLPLRPLLDSLERVFPGDTLVRGEWTPVGDTLQMRWSAVREPMRSAARRDTLLATSRVKYRIDARNAATEFASCGTTTPLTAEVGLLSRWGWRDDWGLESRSAALSTIHSSRCKPRPPGVNFTEIVAHRLDALVHPAMGRAMDSLVARDRRSRALVEGVWSALQQPFATRVQGLVLDFAPRRIVAGTPLLTGETLTAELTVVVAPRLLWRTPVPSRAGPLPENQVRIAGDQLEVLFDVDAPFDTLRARALKRCLSSPDLDALGIQAVDLAGVGDRLSVTVRSRRSGALRYAGPVGYDRMRYTIGPLSLALEPAGAPASLPGGETALTALRTCLMTALQHDVSDWLVTASAQAGRGLNRELAPGIRIEGGIFDRRADEVAVHGSGIRARMIAAGKARIVAEPFADSVAGGGRSQ